MLGWMPLPACPHQEGSLPPSFPQTRTFRFLSEGRIPEVTTKMTQQSATANQPTKGTNGIGKHTRFLQKKAIPKPALSSAQPSSRVSTDPRSAQSTWCHPPAHTWVFSKNVLLPSNSLPSVLRAGGATRAERPHPSGRWAGPAGRLVSLPGEPLGWGFSA